MVDLAFGLQSKFTGGVKKFQALYQKFKHGLEMEALLAKVGDDAARLEVLLAKAGDDPAKLRKVLRRMSADEFEESMKHYDDVTKMLEDLRNSGNKSDEFVDALRNRRKPGEEPHVKPDEEVKPHDTPEQKPKTDDDGPNNKKDNDEAEKMAALAEAKALLAIANAADEPLPVLQMQLTAVDAQYDAVKRFEYVPKGDDVEVWLIGSRYSVGRYRRSRRFRTDGFEQIRQVGVHIPENYRNLFQVHHVIEFKFKRHPTIGPFLERIRFGIDDAAQNGIPLLNRPYEEILRNTPEILDLFPDIRIWENAPQHMGPHPPIYDNLISQGLENIIANWDNHQNNTIALTEVNNFVLEVIQMMDNGLLPLRF